MEIQTIQKYLHTSPRKLRLVSDMIRQMEPAKALGILGLTPKDAARDLRKALQVVLANAKQGGMDVEKAVFKKIEINESMKMRRFRAGTRGRAKPYKRRMSHIRIVLTDQLSVLSGQLSDKGQSVAGRPVTEKQTTEKPESDNRKQKTDNRRFKT